MEILLVQRQEAVVTLKSSWSEIFHLETVTLRCEITDGGDTEWVYEWLTSGTKLPQEQSEYLTIRVYFNDRRQYNCKGKHKEDENMETEWSNSMSLKAIFLLSLCMNTVIMTGSSVTLTCSVRSSSGWKYYWYKDNTLYKPHTTQDFSDNPQISVSVDGSYRCRGGRGNPVYYTDDSNTVSISTIGESVNRKRIETFCLQVRTNLKQTRAGHPVQSCIGLTTVSMLSRVLYLCLLLNIFLFSLPAGLHKIEMAVFRARQPVVTLDPNWSEIYTGEKITLRCEIHRGDTEWEYEWRKSGSALSETESEIRITEAHSDHTGDYSCRGRMKQSQDHSTNWSDNVTLTVTVVNVSFLFLTLFPIMLCGTALPVNSHVHSNMFCNTHTRTHTHRHTHRCSETFKYYDIDVFFFQIWTHQCLSE
uniref:Ig-like domain-containing protein n=1 Tax=Sphaeramia orbicularis TaxID=375764 RepID=A0A672YC63_9TELE